MLQIAKKTLFFIPVFSIVTYFLVEDVISTNQAALLIFSIFFTLAMFLKLFRSGERGGKITYNDEPSLFVNIIENLTDPFLLLDKDKTIIMANKTTAEVFGNDIVGQNISDYLFDIEAMTAIERAIETGISETVEYTTTKTRQRHFLLRIHPLEKAESELISLNPNDDITIFLGIYDITSIREAEQMRVDFVANVSHELRTPLASILGFVETLQGPAREDEEALSRFLQIMQDEANRMTRLIEDLLSLSHIERDAHILPEETVSLKKTIDNVIETLNIRFSKRSMSTTFSVEEGIDEIIGDRDQLTQVFQNLIENAIKYGEESSNIAVDIKHYNNTQTNVNYAKITITNSGAGIASQHIERLTERFYRVDTARSRSLGGTGLGLAIVKHILQRHEGNITFQSEVGKYTKAIVMLPLNAKPSKAVI